MTDPVWGARVFAVSGALVIAVVLCLDGLPQPPTHQRLTAAVVCMTSAVVFLRLQMSASAVTRPLVAWLLIGCTNITIAMRLVDDPLVAAGLSMLYVWFGTFCALYGSPRSSIIALALTGVGLITGLAPHHGFVRSAVFAVTAVAALSVSTVAMALVSENVRRASTTDALTGALARRGLFGQAPEVARRAHVRGQRVLVVVLDLDGFKAYNDSRGHAAGDELLVAAVNAWRALLPPCALLARTGGDESVVIAPLMSESSDQDLLARLREAAPDGVRASAGAVTWGRGISLDDVLQQADASMYSDKGAKARGRS